MRLIKSFGYAFAGISHCCARELNFRIHLCFTAMVIIAGFVFKISSIEWIIVSGCIGIVLSLEMLNSAIEHLCDVVSPEKRPQIKSVKDIAAGAVLLVAIVSACIGTIIFLPKLITFIKLTN